MAHSFDTVATAGDDRGEAGHVRERRASTGSDPMPRRSVWADIALGLLAGLVATQVTNVAQRPLKWVTPARVERYERRVSPGPSSSWMAARRIGRALDVSLPTRDAERWGKAIHLATGMVWGPVYGLCRRYGGLRPVAAALASGGALSLLLDEALVPALGLSAPNRRCHPITHLRGLAAHLVYGAAVALATEGIGRLAGHPTGKP